MMGAKRSSILATLAFLMLMGVAVYFRLWAIHYNLSADDTQIIRLPFLQILSIPIFFFCNVPFENEIYPFYVPILAL